MAAAQHRLDRLKTERRNWNKARPYGFAAKPAKNPDGTTDLGTWIAQIPGPKNTPWEGGTYCVKLVFPARYPQSGPKAIFTPPIFHPNVYSDGEVCLTLINSNKWEIGTSVTDILKGLSTFLEEPNISDPANGSAAEMLRSSPAAYAAKIRAYAAKTKADAEKKKAAKK